MKIVSGALIASELINIEVIAENKFSPEKFAACVLVPIRSIESISKLSVIYDLADPLLLLLGVAGILNIIVL